MRKSLIKIFFEHDVLVVPPVSSRGIFFILFYGKLYCVDDIAGRTLPAAWYNVSVIV